MSWAEYLTEHTVGEVGRITAQRLGVTESNVSRWKKGGQIPDARHVVAFAREYRRPVLEALVAAEFLTEAEAKVRPAAAPSLDSLTDQELVEEVLRRMSRRGGEDGGNTAATKLEPGSAPADEDGVLGRLDDEPRVDIGRSSDQIRGIVEHTILVYLDDWSAREDAESVRALLKPLDDEDLRQFVDQAVADLPSAHRPGLKAARRGPSRGKQLREELDAAGEEPQGEAPDGGA